MAVFDQFMAVFDHFMAVLDQFVAVFDQFVAVFDQVSDFGLCKTLHKVKEDGTPYQMTGNTGAACSIII